MKGSSQHSTRKTLCFHVYSSCEPMEGPSTLTLPGLAGGFHGSTHHPAASAVPQRGKKTSPHKAAASEATVGLGVVAFRSIYTLCSQNGQNRKIFSGFAGIMIVKFEKMLWSSWVLMHHDVEASEDQTGEAVEDTSMMLGVSPPETPQVEVNRTARQLASWRRSSCSEWMKTFFFERSSPNLAFTKLGQSIDVIRKNTRPLTPDSDLPLFSWKKPLLARPALNTATCHVWNLRSLSVPYMWQIADVLWPLADASAVDSMDVYLREKWNTLITQSCGYFYPCVKTIDI